MTAHAALLFLAAFTVRMALAWWLELYAEPFRGEIQNTAVSLATLGVFGNPYAAPTGPTAHVSPLHPLLLSVAFRVFGTGQAGEVASLTLNAVLAGLLYAALPTVGRRLGLPDRASLAAAWFGALIPFHYLNELRSGDSQLAALALMGIVTLAIRDDTAAGGRWRHIAERGLTWAAAALVLPTLLVVIGAVTLTELVTAPGARAWRTNAWRATIGSALVALAVVSPWALRNLAVLGEPIWTRSNLGIEMRISFNDLAWPDIDRNRVGGAWDQYHPSASASAALLLRDEGEVAYNRRLLADTVEWTRQHRSRALSLVAQRTLYFWLPYTQRPLQRLFLSALSVLGLVGLVLLFRGSVGQRRAALLIAAVWTSFPLIYYLTQSAVRYRYPMIWTLLLTSSMAVLALPDLFRRMRRR